VPLIIRRTTSAVFIAAERLLKEDVRILDLAMECQFESQEALAYLPETLKYIWGSWLAKSGYEYVEKPDFELYMEGFNDQNPDNVLQIFIPISKR